MFLSIKTDDLYRYIAMDPKFADIFDFQTYKPDHPLFSFGNRDQMMEMVKKNKDILGKFKDEAEGQYISELVFLRAKMYSYMKDGESKALMKAKGVKKSAMKQINQERYKACLFNTDDYRLQSCDFFKLSSKDHLMNLASQKKTSLSNYDDKRYYLDAIRSIPHGHHNVGDPKDRLHHSITK